jgi:hypothetical protein
VGRMQPSVDKNNQARGKRTFLFLFCLFVEVVFFNYSCPRAGVVVHFVFFFLLLFFILLFFRMGFPNFWGLQGFLLQFWHIKELLAWVVKQEKITGRIRVLVDGNCFLYDKAASCGEDLLQGNVKKYVLH